MKMKLLFVPFVMVVMSVPGVTTYFRRPRTTSTTWTTGAPHSAVNLDGKMFTLSSNGGGITFYPASYTPPNPRTKTTTTITPMTATYPKTTTTTTRKSTTTTPKTTTTTTTRKTTTTPKTTTTTRKTTITPKTTTTTRKTTTTPKTTTTTTTPKTTTTTTPKTTTTTPKTTTTTTPKTTTTTPRTTTQWTTTPRTTPLSTTGLSVCLRYLTDYMETRNPPLLKLFPSSSESVTLGTSYSSLYTLSWGYYKTPTFRPNIQFWPGGFPPDIWTRVCVTVDSAKKVGQVFSGSNMSIRKILLYQLPQGNDPVIYVPGFDGQLTDVQMWDYPLNYREIIQYMRPSTYRPYRGSVLTWSDISYSLGGNALLEDTYETQERQPISKRGRGRGLRREKKSRRVFKVEESQKREGGEFH